MQRNKQKLRPTLSGEETLKKQIKKIKTERHSRSSSDLCSFFNVNILKKETIYEELFIGATGWSQAEE